MSDHRYSGEEALAPYFIENPSYCEWRGGPHDGRRFAILTFHGHALTIDGAWNEEEDSHHGHIVAGRGTIAAIRRWCDMAEAALIAQAPRKVEP